MDRTNFNFLKWASSANSRQPEASSASRNAPQPGSNNPFRNFVGSESALPVKQNGSTTPPNLSTQGHPAFQEHYPSSSIPNGYPAQDTALPYQHAYPQSRPPPLAQSSSNGLDRLQGNLEPPQHSQTVQLSGGGVRMGYGPPNGQPVPMPDMHRRTGSSPKPPSSFPPAEPRYPREYNSWQPYRDSPPAYEPYSTTSVDSRSDAAPFRQQQAQQYTEHPLHWPSQERPQYYPEGQHYHPQWAQYGPPQAQPQYYPGQAQYHPYPAPNGPGPSHYNYGALPFRSEPMEHRGAPMMEPPATMHEGYGPPSGGYQANTSGNRSMSTANGAMPSTASIRPGAQLDGVRELNILILGETGVGKSTFINAFVNYIHYQSIDEALSKRALQCVIPSSFTWQGLQGDDWIAKDIDIEPNAGDHNHEQARKDEKNGRTATSATQVAKTHTVQMGNTLLRLIDTPGIGDTRGSAQDKENMDNILATVRTMDLLHGILILLKPNSARLTVMFSFCLKELLTQLHRDAAKNIVFGFTNARNTSFRPGETYTTLKQMLKEDQTVGIQLGRSITYCFDSESFRCLAAHYKGVDIHDMGEIEDYRLSWNKSAAEAHRMLEHMRDTTAHNAVETWDLHNTREMVRVLTKPMADITQTINSNIALQKDEQRKLTDALAQGQVLQADLRITKKGYDTRELSMPRTVCTHKDCIEVTAKMVLYNTICHDTCYLEHIPPDTVQYPELKRCWAFNHGGNGCIVCGHPWEVHQHVFQEAFETTEQADDPAVAQRISENASDVEIAEQALRTRQQLIKDYELEREIIQKAAGQFAVFLKNSSIKPWNDAKLAYLDHLIDEEKCKVEVGGDDKRLNDLRADRAQHVEEIRTLTDFAKSGENDKLLDQEGIKNLINNLYTLKLTGPALKKCAQQLQDIQKKAEERSKGHNAAPKKSHSLRAARSHNPPSKQSGGGMNYSKQPQQQSHGVTGLLRSFIGS